MFSLPEGSFSKELVQYCGRKIRNPPPRKTLIKFGFVATGFAGGVYAISKLYQDFYLFDTALIESKHLLRLRGEKPDEKICVASTFYILRPVLDVLEERKLGAEKQTAIDSLRAVADGKGGV